MREYDDYDDENVRLYTPVFQRVMILAGVIIAVPVMMWTITTFVRSYVARPKVPALEHLASVSVPARVTATSPAPPSPAPSPPAQSAVQRVDRASASDAPSPVAAIRNGSLNLASLPDANSAPIAANSRSSASGQAAPIQATASAVPVAATTASDITTGSSSALPAPASPKPPLSSRSNDNATSTSAPSSSDRGQAWPNPNTMSPPDFTAQRVPPSPAPTHTAAITAAVEAVPADEPIHGRIPLPRHRPGIVVTAAAMSDPVPLPRSTGGPVPLPRTRPVGVPAQAASSVNDTLYGYRPGLDSDR